MRARFLPLNILLPSAALFLLSSVWGAAAAQTECTRLVLTGHPSYPPVAWADGSTLRGGGISLVRRLAEDNGVPISVVNVGNWDAAQAAVREGKADAIVGVYMTKERAAFLDYVEPAIAPDPSAIVVKAGGNLAYKNWDSLLGKKGVVNEGESYGPKFDAFLKSKLTMQTVQGFPAIYDALIENKADYGLIGYYAALAGAPKDKVTIAVPNFVTENLYLAFGKNSACGKKLSRAFSKGIKTAVSSGTVKKLFAVGLADYQASRKN